MYKIKIKIDDLPKTRNALADRRWNRHQESKKWESLVAFSVGFQIPEKPLEKADLHLIRASSAMPDYDGLVSSFKYVIDALVKVGILKDDNLKICPYPLYEWKKTKPKKGFIEVEVKECLKSTTD